MPSISSDTRFLGVDLRALWRDVRQAWSGVHEWPVLAWVTPAPQVVLLHPGEGQSFWRGDVESSQPVGGLKASFTALELPEEYVLRRSLVLPAMGEADAYNAIALEARAVSPFPAGDLAWGYRTSPATRGGTKVELVLASRRQVGQYIESQAARLGAISDLEVWVRHPSAPPTVLLGYGEGQRQAHARRWRNAGYGLLGLAAVLLIAIALTPTLQLRMRALEAAGAYQGAVERTASLVKEREALMQSVEQLSALSEVLGERIEPLRVLDRLTQVLPDETALQSFKLQGRKVTIAGITSNASGLMQLLGEQPGLRDVKAPSAATRLGGATKESFVIEFMLDTQQFGVVGSGSVAAPTAVPATAAVSPASAASAPVALPASPAATASAGAAAAPSSAPSAAAVPARPASRAGATPSFGGGGARPSFGGGRATPAAPASAPGAASGKVAP